MHFRRVPLVEHNVRPCPSGVSHRWDTPKVHVLQPVRSRPYGLKDASFFGSLPRQKMLNHTKTLHLAQNLHNSNEKQSVTAAQPLRNPHATLRNPTRYQHATNTRISPTWHARFLRHGEQDFADMARRVARGCVGVRAPQSIVQQSLASILREV